MTAVIKKYSKDFGLPEDVVKGLWEVAKSMAAQSVGEKDPSFDTLSVGLLKKLARKEVRCRR